MFNREQLEAIIHLAEAHTMPELITVLQHSLQELGLAVSAEYYEIYNPAHDKEFASENIRDALIRNPLDPSFMAIPVKANSDFALAIANLEIVKDVDPSRTLDNYVIPVIGRLHAVGLLAITGQEYSLERWEFICAFVDIFGSLMALIRKKERDALTGLLNRLVFEERLLRIINYCKTGDRRTESDELSLCYAMVDIDNFKRVNDDFGHLYGDEVLVHFSQIITRSFRYFDLLCRYGGEEFAVVLRGVNLGQAEAILERFRKTVECYPFPQVGPQTVSVGVVQIYPGDVLPSVIDKADKALYYSKSHGRNQVNAFETLVEAGELLPHKVGGGDVELF